MTETKKPFGRPSKLTPEMFEEANVYLDETCSMSVNTLLPTIEGLALCLHIHRDSLYKWAEENKDFSDILERLRQSQAQKILQNSMLNRYNSTISKLMLSKHGYIEQKDVTTNGKDLPTPILGGLAKDV